MSRPSAKAIRASMAASIARGLLTRAAKVDTPGATFAAADDFDLRRRCRAELERRRTKPNPQARPPASDSPALRALRKLARGTERERAERVIRYVESLHRPETLKRTKTVAPSRLGA